MEVLGASETVPLAVAVRSLLSSYTIFAGSSSQPTSGFSSSTNHLHLAAAHGFAISRSILSRSGRAMDSEKEVAAIEISKWLDEYQKNFAKSLLVSLGKLQ